MADGVIRFAKDSTGDGYKVYSNVHTTGDACVYVGRVRRQRDYSVAAKRRVTPTYVWYAIPIPGVRLPELGPYASRMDAAKTLV
jgi:hypothetical protein